VRSFVCAVCGRLLVFENSVCVTCGSPLGYDPGQRRIRPVPADGSFLACANLDLAGCNWLVPAPGGLCGCCQLTRTRPADDEPRALIAFARAEAAKRRLVYQLVDLGLPVLPKARDDVRGLAFDLLSSAGTPVVTGHADGIVTIDLAEGHDVHREAMRLEMAEPYRTLLGHLRHEVGHYYWVVLVSGNGLRQVAEGTLESFRELFGDERTDYPASLQRHYRQGPPADWGKSFVSGYATAHPWEDWAETFAHYLHIRDALQTAAAYGLLVTGPDGPVADAAALVAVPAQVAQPERGTAPGGDPAPRPGMDSLVSTWLPLTYALNAVNRSMGKDDLYPFVLAEPALAKLGFIHDLVHR
jgi:hypothetical protein